MTRPIFSMVLVLPAAFLVLQPGSPAFAEDAFSCAGVVALAGAPALKPRLYRVETPSPRLHFMKSGALGGICGDGKALCAVKAFVVPGDEVVALSETPDHVCAVFAGSPPRVPSTTGMLPRAGLVPVTAAPLAKDAVVKHWLGAWRAVSELDIVITAAERGRIRLKGDATWGALDPDRVKRGGVNIGEFDATLTPIGDAAGFSIGNDGTTLQLSLETVDDTCSVQLFRVGPYLIASDNRNCGGNNVSFTGVYRRLRPTQ